MMFEALERRRLLAATAWYVSTTGKDTSAGNAIGSPFLTIAKALAVAKSGDTINLRGGTYAGNLKINTPNLTLQSYGSESARISSPITDANIEVTVDFGTEASGCTLRHLEITGGYVDSIKTETTRQDDTNGIYHGASNLLIDHCKIHDSGTHVIKLVPDSDHVTIQNSEIYNSGKRDPNQGQGVDAVNIDDFLFQHNYIHDTTQNAIYVKGGSQRAMIQENEVRNAGFGGILIGQDTSPDFFDTRQNPGEFEAIDCVCQYNRVFNTQDAGLAAWSSLDCTIQNNYARDVAQGGQAGFYIATNAPEKPNQGLTVKNNVISTGVGHVMVMRTENATTGKLTMSGNKYFGDNHFIDESAVFQGTLVQWQALIGSDTGSTITTSGEPAFPVDLNHDGSLDVDDYVVMDSGFANGAWTSDLNLDGKINSDDYVVIDGQFSAKSAAAAAPTPLAMSLTPVAGAPSDSFEIPLSVARLADSLSILA
jgi:hypothetical protein